MSRLNLLATLCGVALFASSAAQPVAAGGFRTITAAYYPAYYTAPRIQTVSYSNYSNYGLTGYGLYGSAGAAPYAGGYGGFGDYGVPFWGGPAVYYSPYSTIYPHRYHNPLSPVAPLYSSSYYTPMSYTVDYAPFVVTNYPGIRVSPFYTGGYQGAYYGSYGYHSAGYCGY